MNSDATQTDWSLMAMMVVLALGAIALVLLTV
jgi:hypothetical protein